MKQITIIKVLRHPVNNMYVKEKHDSNEKENKGNWFINNITGSLSGWSKYFTHQVCRKFYYLCVLLKSHGFIIIKVKTKQQQN